MRVIIEVRPRIQVCNVFITTEKLLNVRHEVNIKLKPSSIVLEYTSESDADIVSLNLSLEGYNVVPNSISALKVEASSITFRLQTKPSNNVAGSLNAEFLHYEETKRDFNDDVPSIIPNEPCQITCKCCTQLISAGAVTFQRVLPLPSATWEDGDWFCHRHSDGPAAETPRNASRIDCLYGMCFILVPTSILNVQQPIANGTITQCSRCQAWLGTLHKGKVKLWNCNILCEEVEPKTALEDFETVVRAAFADSVGMLSRLLVETRMVENEAQYLLLWVMDRDLKLLVNVDNEDGSDNLECQLIAVNSMKVLYLHQLEKTSLVESWQSDVNVQSIDVAKQMFVAGLEHLKKVTKMIPAESRSTNGFSVSYLGLGKL